MSYRLQQVFVLLCVLFAIHSSAAARTFQLDKITKGTQDFFGSVSYDVEKAYAGNHNLMLTVTLSTKGPLNLELLKFETPDQTRIQFTEVDRTSSSDPVTGLQTAEYSYRADIAEGTDPRIYWVTLSFSYPNERNTNRPFWLYVGVRNKGKLAVVADSVSTAEFFTGTTNCYRLELENNFPDYAVNIRSITVKSDPSGLIENTTLPMQRSIEPLQRSAIDLDLKAAPMSFSNLLSGFNDSTRLILAITYDDGYGRVITDFNYAVKLKVRPRDRILILAMLGGVIVGAILKLCLQHLQQQGILTRREVVIAIGVTSFIGLIVSVFALVGQIKIIAFDRMGSYDNPAVIFVIGLAGAVGGAQLLSNLFKMASGAATPKAAPPEGARP